MAAAQSLHVGKRIRQREPPLKDWFLRDWMALRGKRQADIIRDLGWDRGRVSRIVNGQLPYGRADVVVLSDWLSIEPFELLMPPSTAMKLRNFDIAVQHMVAEPETPYELTPIARPVKRRAG